MAASRNGFTPLHDPAPNMVKSFKVGAGGQPVCKGDAVVMNAGLVYAATAGTNPTSQGFGVVLAVYTTAGRPLTFNSTKFIASGQQGRADVCIDPNMNYYVQCVTSVGQSNLGTNVMIDTSAPNALLGISGQSVDLVASASTRELFKIVQVGPFDLLGGLDTGFAANTGVVVKWNYQEFNAPTSNQ